MTLLELAPSLEVALLRADATRADLEKSCATARELRLHGVIVSSARVALTRHLLEDSDVKICCAIDFPLGAADADVKRYETEVALDFGAHEIEVVLNHGHLREGNTKALLRELCDIVEAAADLPVKVLADTTFAQPDAILTAAKLAVEADAKFFTLSCMFGTRAAPLELITSLRQALGPDFGLKVSATAATVAAATTLIGAGANRLGLTTIPRE